MQIYRNKTNFELTSSKRMEMFDSAKLEHVHQLHHFGRQLAILKRIYESYNLIIQRITNGPQQTSHTLQQPSKDPPQISRVVSYSASNHDTIQDTGDTQDDMQMEYRSVPNDGATATAYGVPIPPAAAVRFERLKDRISLYALSEIRSCLDEKDSLMALVCF